MLNQRLYPVEGPFTKLADLREAAGIYIIMIDKEGPAWVTIEIGYQKNVRKYVDKSKFRPTWLRLGRKRPLKVKVIYTSGWSTTKIHFIVESLREQLEPTITL